MRAEPNSQVARPFIGIRMMTLRDTSSGTAEQLVRRPAFRSARANTQLASTLSGASL